MRPQHKTQVEKAEEFLYKLLEEDGDPVPVSGIKLRAAEEGDQGADARAREGQPRQHLRRARRRCFHLAEAVGVKGARPPAAKPNP
jgi:hypothetical protein